MIADWVQETTTTTGTGTVTLAGAVSGYCSFSDVFTAASTVVRYQIIDANGTSRETGYGTFTLSGTTLSRDTVLETLVGGTYDASAPTALTLTSGTHTVSIAADAQAFYPAPMGNADTGLIPSAHMSWFAGGSTAAWTADQQQAVPFLLTQTVFATGLAIYVSTADTGSTSTLGISQMVNGVSTSSYIASATVTTTATGIQTANITDTVLHPGWYLTHFVSDVNSSTLSVGAFGGTATSMFAPIGHINTTNREVPAFKYFKSAVSVNGTLDADPSTVTDSTSSSNSAPLIYLVT